VELKVFLSCTSKLRSITLTGDTAQRTVFDNGFSDWASALERVGERGATTRTLKLSYRSTEPIMELARSIAGGGMVTQDIHHTRGGEPVEFHTFTEQGELIATLAEVLRSLSLREPRASVALLARYIEQARNYAEALTEAEVAGVRLVAYQDFAFKAGIEVTDVTQPKGLEFDYVVLLDVNAANYPDTLESRHLLHIATTRAAHQLWVTHVGTPSPLLPRTS
jgi:DNA helicase II / ATP-dependent DNA helicase PcrA